MKETKTINVGGSSFTIDVDASENLKIYIDNLKQHFAKEEQEEILLDIEQRIAELFNERLQMERREVVDVTDVEHAVSVLGEPNSFDEDEEVNNDTATNITNNSASGDDTTHESRVKNRKLYRDPSNSMIGGVCSGLASYFNIDVVWVRLIAVACVFASALLGRSWLGAFSGLLACVVPLYVILWIIVPKAATKAQVLQMQGKETTIDNIKKVDDADIIPQNRGCLYNGISILGKIVLAGLCVCIGFGLLIALVCGFAITVAAPFAIAEAGMQFDIPNNVIMIGIGSIIMLVLIVLAALVGVCVHIYRSRNNKSTSPLFWWTLLVLFLVALGGSIYSTVNGFSKFMESEFRERVHMNNYYSGNRTTRTDVVDAFTRLEVGNAIDVMYLMGDEYSVEIDAPEGVINSVNVSSVGGKLTLSRSGNSRGSVKAIVTAPTLNALNLSSASEFSSSNLVVDEDFIIEAKSAAKVEITNLMAKECRVKAYSAADIELAGNVDVLYAELSSSADLDASSLRARKANIDASSSSDVDVFVTDTISITASSASKVEYSGRPVCNLKKVSGGAKVSADDVF